MRLAFGTCLAFLAAASATAPEMTLVAYLGGAGTDDCDGIALDRAGDIYLACHSDSPDFPHLPAKAVPRSHDDMDAVVLKIEARTARIVWATRTGGSKWDAAGDLEVGNDGSVYVLGQTESADFPTTADAVQRQFGGPRRDVVVLKLDGGGKIVYSTFLGGTKNDEPTSMAVADDGTVYVGGVTMSSDFPGARVGQFGPGGPPDGFVARLRPGDPKSLQTVLIGGTGREQVTGVALDKSGNVFIAGFTTSSDFPVKNGWQPRFGGEGDAFLAKLRVSDWKLLFSTYLGGSKMDTAYGLTLDSSGNPIVSGVTASGDFPSTQSAFQPRLRGSVDAFVTKLSADGSRMLWSTYYGGSRANSDQFLGGSLAVDEAGRVWFTGMTNSPDLPTRNPSQAAYGGGDFDGFLAALSSDGARLCYGSYFGGNGHDTLEGLAVGGGKIYASGITSSTNLQQKRSQIQRGYGGGLYDAIIIGLNAPVDRSCH
ncbi:MAG: SBBP repeat-containing protein [Bryobacteraceae bacterium]